MDHFILTRFNVPWRRRRSGCDPAWLTHRFKLFKRWTLPSVRSQSCKQFKWLCFFDTETPREYLREAETWNIVEIVPVPDDRFSHAATLAVSQRATSKWVAQTRMDNDDMIAWDFVERVQQNLRKKTEWLTFPSGAAAHRGLYSARTSVANSFLTIVESTPEIKTPYCINHSTVATMSSVRKIASPILWCNMIHERNILNSPRLVKPAQRLHQRTIRERFGHTKLSRVNLINSLIKCRRYQNYLEIGVRKGATFNKIQIPNKIGVGPIGSVATAKMTSDAFFALNRATFDIIFIDGLHHWETVLRDVDNSLSKLNPGGVIIIHDCMPIKREHQLRHSIVPTWNGDVWKALVILRSRPNIDCAVLNCDQGLGIILPRQNTQSIPCPPELTWRDYRDRRIELLRIVDVPNIWRFLGDPHSRRKRKS